MSYFMTSRVQRAKSDYRCESCRCLIVANDPYVYTVGRSDCTNYRLSWMRLCSACGEDDMAWQAAKERVKGNN